MSLGKHIKLRPIGHRRDAQSGADLIVASKSGQLKGKIYFIDFGLSFISPKIEDKAVDLHLLKQAIESKHYKIQEEAFKYVLDGYKKYSKADEVIKRLQVVESRGKNKGKGS